VLDIGACEAGDGSCWDPFIRDREDLLTHGGARRIFRSDESVQRAECGETRIPGDRSIASWRFKINRTPYAITAGSR
jgi:hypothetical protein